MELRSFFYKILIIVGTIITLYALYQVHSILVLFFGAILFASTVRPIVLKSSQRRVPALISILVIYLIFLGTVAAAAIILFPTLFTGVQELLNSQAAILQTIETASQRLQNYALSSMGLQVPLLRVTELQRYLADFQASARENTQAILLDGVRILSEAVILFVLAFYWLTERDRLEELALKMLRLRHREKFISMLGEIETTLGAFVRGQTILCMAVGISTFLALSLLGVRSALALAVFAAVMEAIPMLGPFLGAIPAILIALLDSPEKAVLVALAFIIIQQVESQVLVPKVMERQVGLSPLFVLLALISGNLLAGLPGAIVAIPIAAAIKIIVREFIIAPTVQARKFPVTEDGSILLDEDTAETAAQESLEAPQTPTILTAK